MIYIGIVLAILVFIVGYLCVYTLKPKYEGPKFRLKIVEKWPNSGYVTFKYSNNFGCTWNYIYCAKPPFLDSLDYDWEWDAVTYQMRNDFAFKREKEMFSTYEKVKAYEAAQRVVYQKGNKDVKRQRIEREQQIQQRLKKLNS